MKPPMPNLSELRPNLSELRPIPMPKFPEGKTFKDVYPTETKCQEIDMSELISVELRALIEEVSTAAHMDGKWITNLISVLQQTGEQRGAIKLMLAHYDALVKPYSDEIEDLLKRKNLYPKSYNVLLVIIEALTCSEKQNPERQNLMKQRSSCYQLYMSEVDLKMVEFLNTIGSQIKQHSEQVMYLYFIGLMRGKLIIEKKSAMLFKNDPVLYKFFTEINEDRKSENGWDDLYQTALAEIESSNDNKRSAYLLMLAYMSKYGWGTPIVDLSIAFKYAVQSNNATGLLLALDIGHNLLQKESTCIAIKKMVHHDIFEFMMRIQFSRKIFSKSSELTLQSLNDGISLLNKNDCFSIDEKMNHFARILVRFLDDGLVNIDDRRTVIKFCKGLENKIFPFGCPIDFDDDFKLADNALMQYVAFHYLIKESDVEVDEQIKALVKKACGNKDFPWLTELQLYIARACFQNREFQEAYGFFLEIGEKMGAIDAGYAAIVTCNYLEEGVLDNFFNIAAKIKKTDDKRSFAECFVAILNRHFHLFESAYGKQVFETLDAGKFAEQVNKAKTIFGDIVQTTIDELLRNTSKTPAQSILSQKGLFATTKEIQPVASIDPTAKGKDDSMENPNLPR